VSTKADQLDLFGNLNIVSDSTMAKKKVSAPRQARAKKGGGGRGGGGGSGDLLAAGGGGEDLDASLQLETKRRYLNYALSVITSRALPDVRDGLKPVHRRVLYAMFNDERLMPDGKHRKSAKVVGAVIARYHPHGDVAVYDAMVRMAQDFSLRLPLVDGSGNFGSLDGDGAAAYRYTECRLTAAAVELLSELRQETVPFRATFDATGEEPIVLPARLPNLLVNGSTGIAVGMATNIPPHNLKEITEALISLIEDRNQNTTSILKHIKGPDFPTGGQVLNSKVELRQIYEQGQGTIRLRAEHKLEDKKRGGTDIIVTSIPYGITKATVVEKIAEVIISRKLPLLLDVRDESTTDVRIVLEIKKEADPAMVMAYLYKHTPLQMNFGVNMTCLLPVPGSDVGKPERVGIKRMLEEFIDFRFDVTKKRFEYELRKLRERIHILLGFVAIFDALDEAIRIIRKSDGREDAAEQLMKRFKLDQLQVDAILDLRLYKLARLEIDAIRAELKEKKAAAKEIEAILDSKKRLWTVVKTELGEVADKYSSPRRTKAGGVGDEPEFDEAAFIVEEDAHVVVTRDGWIKRQGEIKDVSKLRIREGDDILAILPGSTRQNVVFFTNFGVAYVTKIDAIPATSGFGDPAQKLFKFSDGERIVSAMTLDPRALRPEELLAVSARGFGQRFAIAPYLEATTRAGRKFARPPEGDEIVGVAPVTEKDIVVTATRRGHVLVCKAEEINKLENPGKGVTVIKTGADDRVIGFISTTDKKAFLAVETEKGGKGFELYADPKKAASRGGKGGQIVKRSELVASKRDVVIPVLATAEGGSEVH
jgi:DNA gyrase subunit A